MNTKYTPDRKHESYVSDLFRTYEYPLYILAFRMSKDAAVAKDIIQEVFLALWNMRDRIPEIDNMEAYLFRMTRFKVIKHLRKASADNNLKEKIWGAMGRMDEDGVSKIEAREFQSVLATVVAKLPAKRRRVYLMRNMEGKTYKDIAEQMNISQHTVKNHLSAALLEIRSFLAARFFW